MFIYKMLWKRNSAILPDVLSKDGISFADVDLVSADFHWCYTNAKVGNLELIEILWVHQGSNVSSFLITKKHLLSMNLFFNWAGITERLPNIILYEKYNNVSLTHIQRL